MKQEGIANNAKEVAAPDMMITRSPVLRSAVQCGGPGWTPLMYALRYNQPENAKLLIQKGANINVKDNENWTPLMFALRYDQPENAKLLIQKGADLRG